MSDTTVEGRLREILTTRVGIAHDQIAPGARLIEDLGMDSLDAVELGIAVEREFDIEVSEEHIAELKTVGDAVLLVERRIAERPSG